MKFIPSEYQQAIFDWIKTGSGDGIVNAVAGAGKTTTLVEAAKLIKTESAIFLAFNKHIVKGLNKKLTTTSVVASTIHSLGYKTLAATINERLRPDNRKYSNIARTYIRFHQRDLPEPRYSFKFEAQTAIARLADLCRLTLTNPLDDEALTKLVSHYDVQFNHNLTRFVFDALPSILEDGEEQAREGIIDFTDMIYLPVKWDLSPQTHDWIFVDECQDLNRAQLELVLKLRSPGGRYLFVGDPHQAIMGFAGADNRSFWNIADRTNATKLPLSICYRCPTSHIKLARDIVPAMKPRDDAPLGSVTDLRRKDLHKHIEEGDLILCRTTAPLISECIQLIKARIPARVRGRDIGIGLCRLMQNVAKAYEFTYEHAGQHLEEYRKSEVARLKAKDADESRIESINDRIECLQILVSSYPEATTVDQLCDEIDELFTNKRASVWLSTVHRAKGLENNRVFILHPEKLPLRWATQQDWQFQQEMNLKYVALTRATDELFIVKGSGKEE